MTQEQPDLDERYKSVRQRISHATKHLRKTDTQKTDLMAVSKGQPLAKIQTLYDLGQRYFGENYAQELFAKAASISAKDIYWSYIGQLQSKKIRKLVEVASEIHCLDKFSHASLIAKAAVEFGKTPYPVWISVNADAEPRKSGLPLTELKSFYQELTRHFPNQLTIRGLMSVPSARYKDWREGDPIPLVYQQLASLAPGIGEGCLSLGMSSDLELAIAAGSTLVRIGTDLFGPRPSKRES